MRDHDFDAIHTDQLPPPAREGYPRDWRWRIALAVVVLAAGAAIVGIWV